MIESSVIQKICSEYDIGDYVSTERVLEGVLNDNYILTTTQGKYFIKSIREKAKYKIKMINEVESFAKSNGIPVVVMMKTKSGEIFVPSNTDIYTLYHFVENNKKSIYSQEDYFSIGEMLGKIHIAGKKELPVSLELIDFEKSKSSDIIEKLIKYRDDIGNKDIQDDTDKLFLKFIDFKLSIIPKIKQVVLPNNNLIHGDYHPGNILLDQEGKIIGICDWEKAKYAPRSYELARSLIYICYPEGYDPKESLISIKSFLSGYLSQNAVGKKEIMDGCQMRVYDMTLSSWIEEKYYQLNDDRGNKFIPHEMDLINLIMKENLFEKIENIISGIILNKS